MADKTILREEVCNKLGTNIYGRLEYVVRLLDERKFDQVLEEVVKILNFLPGGENMNVGTAIRIYNEYDPKPYLSDSEQGLYNDAYRVLKENDLIDENGNLLGDGEVEEIDEA